MHRRRGRLQLHMVWGHMQERGSPQHVQRWLHYCCEIGEVFFPDRVSDFKKFFVVFLDDGVHVNACSPFLA